MVNKVEGFFRDIKANAAAKRAQETATVAASSQPTNRPQQQSLERKPQPAVNAGQPQAQSNKNTNDQQGNMNTTKPNTQANTSTTSATTPASTTTQPAAAAQTAAPSQAAAPVQTSAPSTTTSTQPTGTSSQQRPSGQGGQQGQRPSGQQGQRPSGQYNQGQRPSGQQGQGQRPSGQGGQRPSGQGTQGGQGQRPSGQYGGQGGHVQAAKADRVDRVKAANDLVRAVRKDKASSAVPAVKAQVDRPRLRVQVVPVRQHRSQTVTHKAKHSSRVLLPMIKRRDRRSRIKMRAANVLTMLELATIKAIIAAAKISAVEANNKNAKKKWIIHLRKLSFGVQ